MFSYFSFVKVSYFLNFIVAIKFLKCLNLNKNSLTKKSILKFLALKKVITSSLTNNKVPPDKASSQDQNKVKYECRVQELKFFWNKREKILKKI